MLLRIQAIAFTAPAEEPEPEDIDTKHVKMHGRRVREASEERPIFVAGAVVENGYVVQAAPIIGGLLGLSEQSAIALCSEREWQVERLAEASPIQQSRLLE